MTPIKVSSRTSIVILITLEASSDNIQGLQKKISRITGVKNVEYDNLTYKLLVRYESEDVGERRVEKEIDKLLEGHKVKRTRLSSPVDKKTAIRRDSKKS